MHIQLHHAAAPLLLAAGAGGGSTSVAALMWWLGAFARDERVHNVVRQGRDAGDYFIQQLGEIFNVDGNRHWGWLLVGFFAGFFAASFGICILLFAFGVGTLASYLWFISQSAPVANEEARAAERDPTRAARAAEMLAMDALAREVVTGGPDAHRLAAERLGSTEAAVGEWCIAWVRAMGGPKRCQ